MSESCACNCKCEDAPPQTCQCTDTLTLEYKPRVFGMQYLPRVAEPSMFELLSWNATEKQTGISKGHRLELQSHGCQRQIKRNQTSEAYITHYKSEYPSQIRAENEERVLQQIKANHEGRTKPVANLIKDRLYYQEEPTKVAKTRSSTSSKKKQRQQQSKAKPERKPREKLDEEKDKEVIKQRKERIKQFNRETRNLPNSAFKTYFGKPAFENYGCGNFSGNGHLLSHNVMPHCGQNHPKNQETYQSALLNGHKYIKPIAELPRKCDENYVPDDNHSTLSEKQRSKIPLHLDLPKPDLINADRFADKAESPRLAKSQLVTIPRPKPSVEKPTKKSTLPARAVRPASSAQAEHPKKTIKSPGTEVKPAGKTIKPAEKGKGKKKEPEAKQHPEEVPEKELKFMNERQNFIDELKEKKVRNSRLAYKVTECYPVVQIVGHDNPLVGVSRSLGTDLINPKDYKKIDKRWTERIPAAGKPAEKHVDIKDLFSMVPST